MISHHPKLKPPRWAQRFLRWYCKPDLLEDIEGDIHEDFIKRGIESGARSARFHYALDVIRFFKPFAIRKFSKTQNTTLMFRINSKIAFRNLIKDKVYSFINITGLAIGIAACLIITHYVLFQLSFDRFHQDSDRIFRVTTTSYRNGQSGHTGMYCGFALAPALEKDIPEIEETTRIHEYYGGAIVRNTANESKPFQEENLLFVDPSFLQIFSFPLIEGNKQNALNDPLSVVISEKIANKYFGENHESVIGQTLKITGRYSNEEFTIKGVAENPPSNSHLKFDILLPMEKVLQNSQYKDEGADWGWSNFFMYAKINNGTTEASVENKIVDLMKNYDPDLQQDSSLKVELGLESLLDIHLKSSVSGKNGAESFVGSMNTIYFLILIAAFILVIVWINFINLSTAKASERGLEVGIKKAMGAIKPQLIAQFLIESFWVNLLALVLGIGISYLLLPSLGQILDEPLTMDLPNPVIFTGLLSIAIVGPLLAGLYPAFILSSFKTIHTLKGKMAASKGQYNLRKGLVVFQFVISTLLIAGTFAVSSQLRYMKTRDTGIDMDQILIVKGPTIGVRADNFEAFTNGVKKIASVENMGTSRSIPGAGYAFGTTASKEGAEEGAQYRIDATWVDNGFMGTYGMELVAGRDFSDATPIENNLDHGLILSETGVKTFDLGSPEEAIGQKLIVSGETIQVRGVVKDHNWRSLHNGYVTSAFFYTPESFRYFSVRMNRENVKATLEEIENLYTSSFPSNPIDYYFLDEFFNRQYRQDQQFSQIFNAFAGFAIFAACLGLFGLASYTVVQKAKEIGIRKVLGAKSFQITILFSKRYMILILVANIIAVPIAYFGIKSWLQNFAFSIPISAELFVFPVLILAIIAIVTISFQTVKASLANPTKNLRSE